MASRCCVCSLPAAAEHRGLVTFSGLPVPGVTVTATQGDKRSTGGYRPSGNVPFAELADGNWTIKVEMLCFTPVEREVAVAPGAPAPEWELKLLPFDEIKASAPPPPVETPAAPPTSSAATPGPAATPGKTQTAAVQPKGQPKGTPKLPKGVPPPQAANTASAFSTQANVARCSQRRPKAAADTNGNGSNGGSARQR
jgi:hypothetical protein